LTYSHKTLKAKQQIIFKKQVTDTVNQFVFIMTQVI